MRAASNWPVVDDCRLTGVDSPQLHAADAHLFLVYTTDCCSTDCHQQHGKAASGQALAYSHTILLHVVLSYNSGFVHENYRKLQGSSIVSSSGKRVMTPSV